MEKLIAQLLFLLCIVLWLGWVLTRRFIGPDIERGEKGEPPSDARLRWYIRNMRQDIAMLAVTNFAILLVLVFALILKF
jgi:hypothetical protein